MIEDLLKIHGILDDIVAEGAYSSIALSKEKSNNHRLITKIVYGVLDNYIDQLTNNRPKRKIRLLLMIGMYCIEHMDSMPDYAVVDNVVEITKKIGKKQLSGFVNAVLKKSIDYEYILPNRELDRLSIEYSKPIFLVKNYIDCYGLDESKNILAVKPFELEHIRHNLFKITKCDLNMLLKENDIEYIESKAGGFFVRLNEFIYNLFRQGIITYQSLTSMLCIQALELKDDSFILDLCSAPGGKAIYMAENAPGSKIFACDIHNNRLELIKSYISRMGVTNITVMLNDATVGNSEFYDRFDYVLCDVPCSGMGLIHKKPDIVINKTIKDIEKLNEIQYNIIVNAGKYVKKGGILLYSTCSTIKSENQDIVNKFIELRTDYKLDSSKTLDSSGMKTFLPDNEGQDGFFIARLRRL